MATNEVNDVAAGESPSVLSPAQPKFIFNVEEFAERAKQYVSLVADGGLLVDLEAQERFAKRTMSCFVLDKLMRKICWCTKSTLMKALDSLEVRPQQIIKWLGYFIWDILKL